MTDTKAQIFFYISTKPNNTKAQNKILLKHKSVVKLFLFIKLAVKNISQYKHLFAVYIGDLVVNLTLRNKMCIALYADDILLIASSLSELQKLLYMCECELQWLDMCINVRKTCCLRIGPRYDAACANIVTSSGLVLPWVDEYATLASS